MSPLRHGVGLLHLKLISCNLQRIFPLRSRKEGYVMAPGKFEDTQLRTSRMPAGAPDDWSILTVNDLLMFYLIAFLSPAHKPSPYLACDRVSFTDDISESVCWIVFILHTHIP